MLAKAQEYYERYKKSVNALVLTAVYLIGEFTQGATKVMEMLEQLVK